MNLKINKMLSVLLSFLFTLNACSSSALEPIVPTDDDPFAIKSMRSLVQKKVRKNKIVGLSVALVDDQKIIWSEGFGWADKTQKIPATADTVYQVGSTTKLFTATAIMRLAEQGLLDIDAPLSDILPAFSIQRHTDSQASITPRNMMTHHSGLPSDYVNGSFSLATKPSSDYLLRWLKDEYLTHEPNTEFSYSNVAVALLGNVIEAVRDQAYAHYMQTELLAPMGMLNAQISSSAETHPLGAKSYFEGKEAVPVSVDGPQAAGALISSVKDMARFAQMVFAGGRSGQQQIITSDTLNEMMRYQDTEAPFTLHPKIGLNWMLNSDAGDEVGLRAGHGGSTYLHNSAFELLLKHRLGVIVLANSESAQEAVYEIADDVLAIALQSIKGIRTPTLDEIVIPATVRPATKLDLAQMPGIYTPVNDEDGGGLMTIRADGDQFEFEQDGDTLSLTRRDNGMYYFSYQLLGISVDLEGLEKIGVRFRSIHGRDLLIANLEGVEYIIGQKVSAYPIPEAWRSRLGAYEVVNSKSVIDLNKVELIVENDLLIVRSEVKWPFMKKAEGGDTVLIPLNADLAVIHGMGRGTGETIRVRQIEGKEFLSYQGFLLRRKT